MPPLTFPTPNVPILGQVLKAHMGYVLVTFTCLCKPTNDPQLIRGTDQAAVCPSRGNVYRIVKVDFDASKGQHQPQVVVALIGRAEVPPGPMPPAPVGVNN